MEKKLGILGFGVIFGFTLSRVGASEFDLIYGMFTGQDFKLVGVIITAILVAHLGMRVLQSRGNLTRQGQPVKVSHKKLGQYSAYGALLFGLGWGMTGACPGTVLAQLGEGKLFAVFTFAGMIFGTYLYALLKENNQDI